MMPKAKKVKFYAVRNGREGPKVYQTWAEASRNVSRFPGAVHKSFTSAMQAEQWLQCVRTGPSLVGDVMSDDSADEAFPHQPYLRPDGQAMLLEQATLPSVVPPEMQEDPDIPIIELSQEQRAVLERVKRGESVFFTGSAGTGKSVLLREIIKFCRIQPQFKNKNESLAITASTGIASVNIGGTTLHSWAGIGLGKEPVEKLLGKLLGQDKHQRMNETSPKPRAGRVVERWRSVKTLIIDEISMIDGKLFDKLEYIARALRNKRKTSDWDSPPAEQPYFGGIQLVLCGDFCQLPPVPDSRDGIPQSPTFAFDARTWDNCVGRPVFLKKVFRQKDQDFVDMLNEMRFARLEERTVARFMQLSRRVEYTDGIEPTDLFPTRREVDAANGSRLSQLPGVSHIYKAVDTPGIDEKTGRWFSTEHMERCLERLVAPKSITLKEGAQVMLIKNIVQGQLVNGSVGRVEGFFTAREAVDFGTEIAMTEDEKSARPQNRDGKQQVPQELLRSNSIWPMVKFQNGRSLLCVPSAFEVNNAEGKVEARRDQVPLILAWALSIHKSQGQTLERVRVNLGRIFEKGQAYVALSRATKMETLEVHNFDPAKVMAHPRVLSWMSEQTGQQLPDDVDEDLEFWGDL